VPLYFSGFDPPGAADVDVLMPEARPVSSLPATATAVVICLHGFTGTPQEVQPAVTAITQSRPATLATVAPTLPQHGYAGLPQQQQAFAQLRYDDLLTAARTEIARARQRYTRVGMFGFSMGGAIALLMAAEGRLDACAVAAPALRLPVKAEVLIPLLGWASFRLKAPNPYPGYDFHHSHALLALWRVGRVARRRLAQIQVPVLGIHSRNDHTVPPIVLPLMEKSIKSPLETAWFDDSDHVMLLDNSGAAVAARIAEFFQQQFCPE